MHWHFSDPHKNLFQVPPRKTQWQRYHYIWARFAEVGCRCKPSSVQHWLVLREQERHVNGKAPAKQTGRFSGEAKKYDDVYITRTQNILQLPGRREITIYTLDNREFTLSILLFQDRSMKTQPWKSINPRARKVRVLKQTLLGALSFQPEVLLSTLPSFHW